MKDDVYVINKDGDKALNTNIEAALSGAENALITTTYEDDYRIAGYERVYEDFIEDLPSGISYYLFDISAVPSDRMVFVLPPKISAETGPIKIEVFRNPTVSDNGTELETHNPVDGSAYIHYGKLYVGAIVTAEGTKVIGRMFGSEGGFFSSDNGGEVEASQPSTAENNILIKLTNNTGGTVDFINGYIAWFELEE